MARISIVVLLFTLVLAILAKEAECHRKRNYWVVYDYQSKLDKERHRRPSSCILAGFDAKIIYNNQEIAIPSNSTARNHTCTLSADSDMSQKFVISWGEPPSSLSLYFVQDNGTDPYNSLDKVELSSAEADNGYSLTASTASGLNLMRAPQLFAFYCHHPLNISLDGSLQKLSSQNATEDGDGVANAKNEEKVEVTLVLHNVRVEPFRRERHYDDFTHLKFDCNKGWPYSWVNPAIGSALLVSSLGFFVAFFLRYKKRSRRYSNLREESEAPST